MQSMPKRATRLTHTHMQMELEQHCFTCCESEQWRNTEGKMQWMCVSERM